MQGVESAPSIGEALENVSRPNLSLHKAALLSRASSCQHDMYACRFLQSTIGAHTLLHGCLQAAGNINPDAKRVAGSARQVRLHR